MDQETYNRIRSLVEHDRLIEAINELKTIAGMMDEEKTVDEIVSHLAGLKNVESDKRLGIITNEEFYRLKAIFRNNILSLSRSLYSDRPSSLEKEKQIEVRLGGKFKNFSEDDEKQLIRFLALNYDIDTDEIKVNRIIRSSIIVVLTLSSENAEMIIRRRGGLRNERFISLNREYLRDHPVLSISYFHGIDKNLLQEILGKDVRKLENLIGHLKIDLDLIIYAIRENLKDNHGVVESLQKLINLYQQMIAIYRFFEERVEGLPYQDYILNKLKFTFMQSDLYNAIFSKFFSFNLGAGESSQGSIDDFESDYSQLWTLLKRYSQD